MLCGHRSGIKSRKNELVHVTLVIETRSHLFPTDKEIETKVPPSKSRPATRVWLNRRQYNT
jgi:hypothetical protein